LRWVTPYGWPPGFGYYGRASLYTWMATESFLYSARMRRRMRLGLGDPVVANRLWLWGWASAASAMMSLMWWVPVTLSLTFFGVVLRTRIISFLGLFTAVFIGFAFYPPKFYVRMVERHAARARARRTPSPG